MTTNFYDDTLGMLEKYTNYIMITKEKVSQNMTVITVAFRSADLEILKTDQPDMDSLPVLWSFSSSKQLIFVVTQIQFLQVHRSPPDCFDILTGIQTYRNQLYQTVTLHPRTKNKSSINPSK